jgi:hypothetical protein
MRANVWSEEGDPADSVFRLLSGAVDILRELDGDPILWLRRQLRGRLGLGDLDAFVNGLDAKGIRVRTCGASSDGSASVRSREIS